MSRPAITTPSGPLPGGLDQNAPQSQLALRDCHDVEPSSLSILDQNPGGS